MTYKKDGPLIKNKRKKPKFSYGQLMKGYAKVMGKDILPSIEMPILRKARGPDKWPRNFVEAQLRKDVIKWLNAHGWRWWRIENSITGRSTGLPDFLIAKHKMIFIELKGVGGLTGLQPEFAEWCKRCRMPYYIIRKVEELETLS